jgi:hypothetical protein
VVIAKPKHTMLPVLVVLFVVSYGLMTMLIVEQGKTIDVQRFLIGQLFADSNQLNAIKISAMRQAEAQAKARAEAQTPSSQAAPQDKKSKPRQMAPQKPPKDTSDSSDVRRSLVTI